jgi:hypothetical protein
LTHLTFIFIESHKIRNRVLLDDAGEFPRLDETEAAVAQNKNACRKEKAISHAANILGRTFEEVLTYMMLLDLQQRLIDFTCYILVRKLARRDY